MSTVQDRDSTGVSPPSEELRGRIFRLLALLLFFSIGVGTAPANIAGITLLVCWLFSGLWRRDLVWWRAQPWLPPAALIMLLPAVGLLWTVEPAPNVVSLLHRSHYWIYAGAFACLAGASHRPRQLCIALITGIQLLAVTLLITRAGWLPTTSVIENLLLKGYLVYSLLLVLAMLLLSFLFRREQDRWLRLVILALLAVDVAALSMLNGRNGYLAFALLAPILLLNLVGWRHWLTATVGALLLIGSLSFSTTVRERVMLIIKESRQFEQGDYAEVRKTSVGQRLTYWQGSLQIIREHPLIGVGTGGYPEAMKRLYPQEPGRFSHAHNYYLVLATQYGLLGLVLFIWLCWVTVRRAWPCRDRWGGFAVLSVLAVLGIGCLTDATLQSPQAGILFAAMIGLPVDGE